MRKFIFTIGMGVFLLGGICLIGQTPGTPQTSTGLVFHGRKRAWPVHQLQPVPIGDGRLIVSIADTVYMLGPDGKQLWKYQNETLRCGPAFNASTNEVAVVMYDLQAVRLDASTGQVKWKSNAVGRASYASVASYGRGFLVLIDMSGYRDQLDSKTQDKLEYWENSEQSSWSIEFPSQAELVVDGKRIYALSRSREELRLQELHAPEKSHSPSP